MRTRIVLIGLVCVLLMGTLAISTSVLSASASCPAIQLIGVRGSEEAPGFGTTVQSVVNELPKDTSKSVDSFALPYPAAAVPVSLDFDAFNNFYNSVNTGVSALNAHLASQSAMCPSQRFVLAGYSQGAMVVTQAMNSEPKSITSKVDGIVLFGDPDFLPQKPFDVGTYENESGVLDALLGDFVSGFTVPDNLANKTQDYCLNGDFVCNFDPINLAMCTVFSDMCPHYAYPTSGYTSQGAKFLAGKL